MDGRQLLGITAVIIAFLIGLVLLQLLLGVVIGIMKFVVFIAISIVVLYGAYWGWRKFQ